MVVTASAAAGIDPPVGPVSRVFADAAALAESTRRVRRLGFVGRACIHPAQIPVVHEVFTPTPAEVEAAHAAIGALAGGGVAVDAEGRLIDPAVLPAARRTLAFAERALACLDRPPWTSPRPTRAGATSRCPAPTPPFALTPLASAAGTFVLMDGSRPASPATWPADTRSPRSSWC